MGEQYKIKRAIAPVSGGECWVIIDTWDGGEQYEDHVYHTRVDAEARLDELNNQNYKVTHDLKEFGGREDIRVVTTALKGKVKCSACQTAFHETEGALAIDRFIGYNYENLAVDLRCQICDHAGIYTFDGNPLVDAGLVERGDVPLQKVEPFGGDWPV